MADQQQRDKDQQILEFIRKNPLARETEIARAVKLSRSATHNRLVKLKKSRRLRDGMAVDIWALGFRHRYRVDVTVNPRRLKDTIVSAQEALADAHGDVAKARASFEDDDGKHKGKPGDELLEAVSRWGRSQKGDSKPQEILAFHILGRGEKHPNLIVEDVTVLLGDDADLCATVAVRAPKQEEEDAGQDPATEIIYAFVTGDLRSMASIESTSTCIQAWSCSREMQKRLLVERPKRTKSKQPVAE